VFAALAAPAVWSAGPPGWLGALAGFAAMRWTGQFLPALLLSLLAFFLVRHFMA
jgi:hypothetical protein